MLENLKESDKVKNYYQNFLVYLFTDFSCDTK